MSHTDFVFWFVPYDILLLCNCGLMCTRTHASMGVSFHSCCCHCSRLNENLEINKTKRSRDDRGSRNKKAEQEEWELWSDAYTSLHALLCLTEGYLDIWLIVCKLKSYFPLSSVTDSSFIRLSWDDIYLQLGFTRKKKKDLLKSFFSEM